MSTHRRMIGSISVQIAVIANAVLSEFLNFDLEAAGFLGELRRIKNRVGALVGRGISADSFTRILDNSVLDLGGARVSAKVQLLALPSIAAGVLTGRHRDEGQSDDGGCGASIKSLVHSCWANSSCVHWILREWCV
jgi:hypothetical protein